MNALSFTLEEMGSGNEEYTNQLSARKTLGHPHSVSPAHHNVCRVKDKEGLCVET